MNPTAPQPIPAAAAAAVEGVARKDPIEPARAARNVNRDEQSVPKTTNQPWHTYTYVMLCYVMLCYVMFP